VTEDEAKLWLKEHHPVSRETEEKLEAFVAFLKREAASQNLISASTLDHIWDRHIVDSAQLLRFCPDAPQVESRGRRIDYLQRAIALLDLEARVTVAGMPLERVETAPYSVISARAFAPLGRLFELAERFSTNKTLWLLPKGRNAAKEWDEVQSVWKGEFLIESSVTDAEAGILVGHLTGQGA
jgi:16S rRNA (guanine527-N7)-methyltransferase